MRTCPTCGNSFSDELSYCLQDGTFLGQQTSGLSDRPTEIYQPQTNKNTDISTAETIAARSGQTIPAPVQPQSGKAIQFSAVEPKSKMGCAVSIGVMSGAAAVFIALGVVGLIFRGRNEVASSKAPQPVANSVASNSANIGGSNPANVRTTPLTTSTPTTTSTPRPISGGVLNGKAIELPQPEYPPAARAVKASGSVSVQVLVGKDGRVISASAISGNPLLRSAAESAARSAKFEPTKLNGEVVTVSGVLTYNFTLKN